MKNPPKNISTYNEYNYIEEKMAFILSIINKEPSLQTIKELSLGRFRNEVVNACKDIGISFKFARNFFNSLRDNPKSLLREIIDDGMYNTRRKQEYLKVIEELELKK